MKKRYRTKYDFTNTDAYMILESENKIIFWIMRKLLKRGKFRFMMKERSIAPDELEI